jgi:hypothetical protein
MVANWPKVGCYWTVPKAHNGLAGPRRWCARWCNGGRTIVRFPRRARRHRGGGAEHSQGGRCSLGESRQWRGGGNGFGDCVPTSRVPGGRRWSVEGPTAPWIGGEVEGQDESIERPSEVGLTKGGGDALVWFRCGGGSSVTVLRQ